MVGQIEPHMERAINDKQYFKGKVSPIILTYDTHNKMFISTVVCVKIQQFLPVLRQPPVNWFI